MTILDTNAQILSPHPKLNIPLQRIGRFLNISRQSLLGIDINQEYGLWFAFRGAFLTKLKIKEIKYEAFSSPCETCPTKPCINACPASALNLIDKKFKLNLCSEYQLKLDSSCTDRCLARMSCPYQIKHQYKLDQIQYHMKKKFDILT